MDVFVDLAVTLPHPSGLAAVLGSEVPATWIAVTPSTHHVAGVTLVLHTVRNLV